MSEGKKLLSSTHVKDLYPENHPSLITVEETETAAAVFEKLCKNKILSAPVKDTKHNAVTSLVDMLDLTTLLFSETESLSNVDLGKVLQTPCGKISGSSGRNPYFSIQADTPLLEALRIVSSNKIHRLVVVDQEGDLKTIITQSHLVRFIARNAYKFGSLNDTKVEKIQKSSSVFSVKVSQPAREAFQILYKEKISGVAVVNENGALVGNISASDLKLIQSEFSTTIDLSRLNLPAGDFIKLISRPSNKPYPWTVKLSNTLGDLTDLTSETSAHRIYVVDDQGKPIHVISLGNLLSTILETL